MLKGRSITILDKWGRVRIPAKFRRVIEEKYGNKVFVTSIDMNDILIYPISVWKKLMSEIDKLDKELIIIEAAEKTNLLGMKTEIDKCGKVSIHKSLRDKISLEGKVVVEGSEDHLVLTSPSHN